MDDKIAQYITDTINDNGATLKYQPQFELIKSEDVLQIIGVEALLSTDSTICHTEKFLNVAIESNQIFELGYWILEKAAGQYRHWVDQFVITSKFNMSVNVAGEQLKDDQFCKTVLDIIDDVEVQPSCITLELTETSLIDDTDISKIHKLTNAGINISIDDFGTGYSSLARLKLLPVHEIKIDKMFVDDITQTDQDVALITALYQLTNALNKFTIVEGVENKFQYFRLRDIGFTCFQGYYFSEALDASEFEDLISLIKQLHCQ